MGQIDEESGRSRRIQERLMSYEQLVRDYLLDDPVDRVNRRLKEDTDEYNTWLERGRAGLDQERATLEQEAESLHSLEAQIRRLDERLDRRLEDDASSEEVKAHDDLLTERNTLVEGHNRRAQEAQPRQELYNQRAKTFQEEASRKRAVVEESQRKAKEEIDRYEKWMNREGPNRLWVAVNETYADLLASRTEIDQAGMSREEATARIQKLRQQIAEWTQRDEAAREERFLVVPALLGASLEAFLMVDNGASVCSLSPEIVRALGWEGSKGEEVELSLPNAIRIKAPQLLIPSVTCQGQTAQYVKGVVLRESMPGVDGSLGLSFVNRFDYRIDKDGLSLTESTPAPGGPQFDVFISHKSADVAAAREVFDGLSRVGHRPFLSDVSIAKLHTSEFQKAIDRALEEAEHLVVVASCREHLESPWVESEWLMFDGQKRAGKKHGNIVPVLCGGYAAEDLPFALQRYHAILMDTPDWFETLCRFLEKP